LDADGLAGCLLEEGAQDAGGDEASPTCGSRSGGQQQEGDAAEACGRAVLARAVQCYCWYNAKEWRVRAAIIKAWSYGAWHLTNG
jgi:hypothetical protein